MQIFLDTLNLDHINEYRHIIDGITTNPTILSQMPNYESSVKNVFNALKGKKVSIQVTEVDSFDAMFQNAKEIGMLSKDVLIKLPNTYIGLKVCDALQTCDDLLSRDVNMTLTFSPIQAMLAAKVGAKYISVFLGRSNDYGTCDPDLIFNCINAISNYPESKILVASVRTYEHFEQAAQSNAHSITVPYSLLDKIVNNPLSEMGLNKFKSDWNNK